MEDLQRIHDKLDKIFEEMHSHFPKISFIEERLKSLEDKDTHPRLAVLENNVSILSIQVKAFWGAILTLLTYLAVKIFGGLNGN